MQILDLQVERLWERTFARRNPWKTGELPVDCVGEKAIPFDPPVDLEVWTSEDHIKRANWLARREEYLCKPIHVRAYDGHPHTVFISDGNHRLLAHKKLGKETIQAKVIGEDRAINWLLGLSEEE